MPRPESGGILEHSPPGARPRLTRKRCNTSSTTKPSPFGWHCGNSGEEYSALEIETPCRSKTNFLCAHKLAPNALRLVQSAPVNKTAFNLPQLLRKPLLVLGLPTSLQAL